LFKHILLCYDGTESSWRALRRGAELAAFAGARVHLLATVAPGRSDPTLLAAAMGTVCLSGDPCGLRRLLDESLEWLQARGIEADGHITTGDPFDQILLHAKKLGVDLIVLGHYPLRAGGFWWSGASSRRSLSECANCCVLVAVDAPGVPDSIGRQGSLDRPHTHGEPA